MKRKGRIFKEFNSEMAELVMADSLFCITMKDQVEPQKFCVGTTAKVIDCINGHEFAIGTEVVIIPNVYSQKDYCCRDRQGHVWYLREDELELMH